MSKIDITAFGILSYAEQSLLKSSDELGLCLATPETNPQSLLAENSNLGSLWSSDRRIRARFLGEFLRGNLTRDGLVVAPPSTSLGIYGAKIEGRLRIENTKIETRIVFFGCYFSDLIDLQHSQISTLHFRNCSLKHIDASGCTVDGDILLVETTVDGNVDFVGSEIKGSLIARACKIYKSEIGFCLTNSVLHGPCILAECHFFSRIHLGNCLIQGDLNLTSTQAYATPEAILCQTAEITGNVYLLEGFTAHGEADFVGTSIKGIFDCSSSYFLWPEDALSCDRVDIGGTTFLKDAYFKGRARFVNCKIGANLNIMGGIFTHDDKSLNILRARISGSVIAGNKTILKGTLLAARAHINGDLSIERSFIRSKDTGIDLQGAVINGCVDISHSSIVASTCINCSYSTTGTYIRARDAQLEFNKITIKRSNPSISIDGRHCRTGGSIYLDGGFFADGEVNFGNAKISGDVIIDDGEYQERSKRKKIAVISSLLLRGSKVEGAFLALKLARIGRLDLRASSIRSIIDCEESWPKTGSLLLDRCVYETFSGTSPRRASKRIAWLNLQKPQHLGESFRPQPYEQLAIVLRKMGQNKEAQKISIEKSNVQNSQNFRSRKLGYKLAAATSWILFGKLLGYGYRPARTLIAAIALIVAGSIIFDMGYKNGHILPTRARALIGQSYAFCAKPPPPYPAFHAIAFSIDSFVPFLDLHQEENWVPRSEKLASENCDSTANPDNSQRVRDLTSMPSWYELYFWIHISLGWVITTLAVAGFTGLVKKGD